MDSARSMLIVVNPTSGKGRALRTAETVALRLRSRGVDVTIHETTGRDDAERFVEKVSGDAGRPGVVVACGGDGTIQQVVNALAPLRMNLGTQCPAVGLAPAGRCNDFARIFGIGRDPVTIADTLLGGTRATVDLGRVNDRYFCTVATVGVDADISSYVDRMRMPIRGTLAYIYGTLCVLRRYRGRAVRISGDFGDIVQRVFLASSANTSSYGGAIRIAPHAVPDDGHLDLCVIDDIPRTRSLWLLARVLFGRHTTLPEVRFLPMSRMRVEADETIELWADGERIASTPADITVAPKAVEVIVPRDYANGHDPARIRGSWSKK